MGHSRLGSRDTTRVHESMECLVGVAASVNVLVHAATSLGGFAFQGPSEANWVSIVLGDDVQQLSSHHRADGRVGRVPEALQEATVGMSVEGRCSHVATLPRPLACVGVGARGDWHTRPLGGTHVNH